MNDKTNKSAICSIISLDIVDYTKKTDAEQIEIKNQFNQLINQAVIDIPQNDRTIVDAGQHITIACNGPLEDALEDALFIAITIRDEILKNNMHSANPLYVLFGINLGSVRVLKGINGQPNIVGDGVDEAQRIMSFANPNQILVSNVYYEMASKLTQEIAQMFEKYDMHAHDHEVYAVRLLKDKAMIEDLSDPNEKLEMRQPILGGLNLGNINWRYAVPGVLILLAFFALAKLIITPVEPTITLEQPAVAETDSKPASESAATAKPAQADSKAKVATKKPKQAVSAETKQPVNETEDKQTASSDTKAAESKTEKGNAVESGWQNFKDSIKQGADSKCTQAQIALNQCAK